MSADGDVSLAPAGSVHLDLGGDVPSSVSAFFEVAAVIIVAWRFLGPEKS